MQRLHVASRSDTALAEASNEYNTVRMSEGGVAG